MRRGERRIGHARGEVRGRSWGGDEEEIEGRRGERRIGHARGEVRGRLWGGDEEEIEGRGDERRVVGEERREEDKTCVGRGEGEIVGRR